MYRQLRTVAVLIGAAVLPGGAENTMLGLEEFINENFLVLTLRPGTMEFYAPRVSILQSVQDVSKSLFGTVLDVGCGFMPYKKIIGATHNVEAYRGMDLEDTPYRRLVEPDVIWDGNTIPLEDESVDCVVATEFLEHHDRPEQVVHEVFRVMRANGIFFATVPFIWNLHDIPYDEYRYTPYSLERMLRGAGFSDIKISALGGWNMALAQMIGMWVVFPKRRRVTRGLLRRLLFPLYAFLVKTDRRPNAFDAHANSMFSGLSITARK